MLYATPLSKSVTNEKIDRLVSAAALQLSQVGKVGEKTVVKLEDAEVTTQLWGFNSSFKRLLVEVTINGIVVDKVLMKRVGDEYVKMFNHNYNYRYHLFLKQGVSK